jgi:PAS domain S-box-containing protein
MNDVRVVLVVDDDAINRKLLQVTLEAEGIKALQADDGVEALEVLERHEVDAVISDILMPRMDGFRLCHELRKSERFNNLAFIIYSATFTSAGDEKLALTSGADRYLRKPCPAEALLAALREGTRKVKAKRHDLPSLPQELEVMRGYSEVLVSKLEEKNGDLERAAEELHQQREWLEVTLTSIGDAVIATDTAGRVTFLNLAAETLTGWSHAEAWQRPAEMIYRTLNEQSRASGEDIQERVLREKAYDRPGYEAILIARDGREVPVEGCAAPIRDSGGHVHGVVLVFRDVTEKRRVQREREQAELRIRQLNAELEQRVLERTAQLEAANKELEAFAYSVSHDLRAPLRGIDGWSMALLEDCSMQLDQRGLEYLDRVRSEAQRMGILIDDLLQLSRITRAETKFDQVDVSALADTVAGRLRESNAGRDIDFCIHPGLTAFGDARLLEIVLTNLLGNAVKFTGLCPVARIEVGRRDTGGDSVFYVQDNGVGFDMAFAGSLFGAFQRLHKHADFPGSGIGLATVHRIIHRHHGRIWAEAEPNRGATFYFTLDGR